MNYQKVYDQIIQRAKNENRKKLKKESAGYVYYEAHHIIPVCLGGAGDKSDWKWHPNIVLLTAREHFICHWLLSRIYPDHYRILCAFWMMCYGKSSRVENYNPSSRAFQEAREAKAKANTAAEIKEKISKTLKGRVSPTKGTKRSEDQIRRSIETRKLNGNSRRTEETVQKIVATRKARGSYVMSEAHKERLRGRRKPQIRLACPHCGKVGGMGSMKRYHFNNCKKLLR